MESAGSDGYLRADGVCMLDAQNDLEAVAFWLWEKAGGSQRTKISYWLHIERLLLWAAEVRKKSLSALTVNDLADYRDFLSDPQPREIWCGPRAPRGSPRWRPFRGPLSPASQKLSMNIISSMFSYLTYAGYLRGNPTVLLRKRRNNQARHREQTVERFLDEDALRAVTETLDLMPRHTREQLLEAERARWLFVLMTTLGLRRDEVVSHSHSAFEKRQRPSGPQWWCRIIGKGDKMRVIPVPAVCITALYRYRGSLGLPSEPLPGDETPLVGNLRKKGPTTESTVYRIIKQVCQATADRIASEHPHAAETLRRASPHWLRHSFVTSQGNMGVSLRHRAKSAGHESIETTSRYDHAVEDEWYQEMQRTPLDSWA